MPGLLVLGASQLPGGGSKVYRGTYRRSPEYQAQFGPDHEVNRAFSQFCELGGQSLVLSDIVFARRLVGLYRDLIPPQEFDLIEAVAVGEAPQFSDDLLGYEISKCGVGCSMLCWGLELTRYSSGADSIVVPLIRLMEESFKPRLNGSGLFDDPQVAQSCLECMLAIHRVAPSYFESDLDAYEVSGLYLVR